jgi:hypothetical protein
MKTHDQSPGPSQSLTETAETVENIGDPDMPEPAAEGDIQTEYSFDYFCTSGIGAKTRNYL